MPLRIKGPFQSDVTLQLLIDADPIVLRVSDGSRLSVALREAAVAFSLFAADSTLITADSTLITADRVS